MPDGDTLRLQVARAAAAELRKRAELRERKQACEDSLLEFVRCFWHVVEPTRPLVEGWPLYLYCDVLTAVAEGYHTRLILNLPPGFTKSLILNVFFPAWLWGPRDEPSLRFISASYSAYLTERDNGRLLRVLQSETYQRLWRDRFRITKDGVGKIENDRTGWKLATSVGGVGTGERGDYILIDDANNPRDVESDAVREGTELWLTEVMPDRLNDLTEGVIINVQQRTHSRDATGVLADRGENYTWIVVPMEFDPDRFTPIPLRWDEDGNATDVWLDPRGCDGKGQELPRGYDAGGRPVYHGKVQLGSPLMRRAGEIAWPERFTPDNIREQKKIKGPYAYANQYGQLATVRGGGIIRQEWWQLWPSSKFPELGTVIASLDTAIKEGEENDYNALTVWGAFAGTDGEPKLILLWAWRDRLPLAQLVARVNEMCGGLLPGADGRPGALVSPWQADYLLIEDKARGHDVAAELLRQFGRSRWQTVLIPANGGKGSQDKRARLEAVAPLFSGEVVKDPTTGVDRWLGNGLVYAPNTEWADAVIQEVSDFPRGQHDDWVDTVSMTLAWVRKNGVVITRSEFDEEELELRRYRKPVHVPYKI